MKILMFSTHSMKYICYSPQKSKYPLYIIHLGKEECHNIHAECGYGVFKKVFFSFYKMLISLLLILGNLLAFRVRNHLYIRAAT